MQSPLVDKDFKTFLVRYRFDGSEWLIELPARDMSEAKERLGRLAYADIDGELVMRLPASTGPLAAIISAIRNAAVRLWP